MPTFDPIRERFYVRMQAATEQIRAKVAKCRGFIPGNSVAMVLFEGGFVKMAQGTSEVHRLTCWGPSRDFRSLLSDLHKSLE